MAGETGHLAGETVHRALGRLPGTDHDAAKNLHRAYRRGLEAEFRAAITDIVRDAVATGIPGLVAAVNRAVKEGIRMAEIGTQEVGK